RRWRLSSIKKIAIVAIIMTITIISVVLMTATLRDFPFLVFASLRIDRQCRCSGRIAEPGVRIGECDGSGVGAGCKAADIDQREGHGYRGGGEGAKGEVGVEPGRNPGDRITQAAGGCAQLILEERGCEGTASEARCDDIGGRGDLQRRFENGPGFESRSGG